MPNRLDDLDSADEFFAWAEGQDFFSAAGYVPQFNLEEDFEAELVEPVAAGTPNPFVAEGSEFSGESEP